MGIAAGALLLLLSLSLSLLGLRERFRFLLPFFSFFSFFFSFFSLFSRFSFLSLGMVVKKRRPTPLLGCTVARGPTPRAPPHLRARARFRHIWLVLGRPCAPRPPAREGSSHPVTTRSLRSTRTVRHPIVRPLEQRWRQKPNTSRGQVRAR